ncbi:hypothetical protein HanRHA438_Chr07g0319651 [Helianthus annuus]|uniref:Uncharacterized protein n=1 Tax=Helianthus annuus TaxID=4232 RepID=A0A9K3INS3_HELAN|nr:hypothetical protein HanXRQr2_Chr07g0310511 [Helianthus annuus]KAJ0551346.1 hypothetical protein HanHA300_Chr07g0256091 [Helianthus annuus]KAJ0564309.1 hypothetical protein HanHA89_Chr07g0272851 [Helianthus annuus]KAJ0732378.1 hypothetical protein HanOQP8_Chr07g0262511 [Helianthus annuus]KAJ0906008.1 hypothetical protein HanPSC8_Chr07g0300561 [Helianthus annuus]
MEKTIEISQQPERDSLFDGFLNSSFLYKEDYGLLLLGGETIGWRLFDITEVPKKVPPDRPLVLQWYKLKGGKGENSDVSGINTDVSDCMKSWLVKWKYKFDGIREEDMDTAICKYQYVFMKKMSKFSVVVHTTAEVFVEWLDSYKK